MIEIRFDKDEDEFGSYLEVSSTERTCFNQPDDSSELRNPLIVNDF